MTDYQRAEKLYLLQPICNRKPSEMMAAVLKMCPRGEEKNNLWCLFLQQLPNEIRFLMSRVDHKDPKLLAEEADALWTLYRKPAATAAIPWLYSPTLADEFTVVSIQQGSSNRSRVVEATPATGMARTVVAAMLMRLRLPGRIAWWLGSA
jgi:hypothetical protein